jgi:hypothetical protein
MSTLIENSVIQSIKIVPATGTIEVERVTQVLRDGEVIATGAPATQKLAPDQDLTAMELEAIVLSVAGAAWTSGQVTDAATALFATMTAQHAQWQAAQDQRLADVERTRAAVAAANAELDAEHATLADRSAKITADRAELFAQSEAIRTQRPELSALLDGIVAALPAPLVVGG